MYTVSTCHQHDTLQYRPNGIWLSPETDVELLRSMCLMKKDDASENVRKQ